MIKYIIAVFLLLSGAAPAFCDDLKPFPLPEAGMQRTVIRLPEVADPDGRRVEVLIGKTVEMDCNRKIFSTTVTSMTAAGWGYPYYRVGELTGPASTMMACPPGMVKGREFVQAQTAELAWLPYRSALPIVVYAPEGVEIRYRLWTATGNGSAGSIE